MKVLVLLGSLRAESFGRKLARAAESLAPQDWSFTLTDCGDVPLYNQDLDGEEKPSGVGDLVRGVEAADALLFLTPEFNYGIPGTLKNAIDWASRPAFRSPLKGKPSLVIGYSPAPTGAARANAQLTAVLGGTLTPVFLGPSFLVPAVHEKFGPEGDLTDDVTRGRLEKTLAAFGSWAKALPASG